MDEVLKWFDKNQLNFLGSIPSAKCNGKVEKIAEMDYNTATFLERTVSQIDSLFSTMGTEGGLFIVVGQKK